MVTEHKKEDYFNDSDLEARIAHLEEQLGLLAGDPTLRNLPYGGLKEAASIFAKRCIGGAGGAYVAGVLDSDFTEGAGAITANYISAIPIYIPAPCEVASIGISVTTLSAGSVRLGIYEDKGEDLLYPGKLVIDAGTVNVGTTGNKSVAVKQGLSRGLKWLALVGNSTPEIRRIQAGGWAALGFDETGVTPYHYYRPAFTYAALPNPFPASATALSGYFHVIWIKLG